MLGDDRPPSPAESERNDPDPHADRAVSVG